MQNEFEMLIKFAPITPIGSLRATNALGCKFPINDVPERDT